MILKRTTSMAAIALCFGILTAASLASAQSPIGSTFQEQKPRTRHHQRIYQLLNDMTQEMTRMTEQMSQGPLPPEQRTQMAQRMAFMSTMMRRLSGLEARPAIEHGDLDKELDQMQKQMDQLLRD